ncbi:MAG TPA: NAD(P)-dependent oxidoreductase [Vicinamibacterales bacterium]|nr:NAD(P)-dependent oxidoreductase [Vicinamibacterales bacterium]
MRILAAEPLGQDGLDRLRSEHDVEVRTGLSPEELRAIVGEFDGLVVRSQVQADEALIAAARRLIVIGRAGVGVDNIDVEAATRAGITVVNAPAGNTIAAAEHTMALLLGAARHLAEADASLRRGEWLRSRLTGLELRGRTLGIVGFGKIGRAVADRARGFEMNVVAHDPLLSPADAASLGVERLELHELLARADVVTLHVPLTPRTRHLIDAQALARMKPGSILLNASRGGVVDEAALAHALHSGHLAGAGIDVFEHEPPLDSPLIGEPNALLTPHLAASTIEAQRRVSVEVAEQILDVLAGRPAPFAVNAQPRNSESGEAPQPGRVAAGRPGPAAPAAPGRAPFNMIPPDLEATLVLLRHGESVFITEGRFQGRAESPLSPLGDRQAAMAGTRLAMPRRSPALPLAPRPPIEIVHSPLQRTTQTARRVASAMAEQWAGSPILRPEPGLAEIAQGAWEGMRRSEVEERYGDLLTSWRRRPLDANAPDGERVVDVAVRARAALERVIAGLSAVDTRPSEAASPEATSAGEPTGQRRSPVGGYPGELPPDTPWTLIVGHDGIFKVLLLTLFDLPLERFWSFPFSLCSLTVIELRDGRPTLRLHNSTEHLAPLLDERGQAESEARLQTGAL